MLSQKIANGQCIWVRRDAYDALGGHAAVKHEVAEDVALAQLWFRAGRTVTLVLGLSQLSTRMYTSLRELIEGWGKNIYAGGRKAMPLGAFGRAIYPLLLVTPGLLGVVPPIVLALGLLGLVGSGALTWAAIATGANLVWWLLVYRWLRLSPVYALLHPLGAAMMLYIALGAIARGRRVRWKERDYRAGVVSVAAAAASAGHAAHSLMRASVRSRTGRRGSLPCARANPPSRRRAARRRAFDRHAPPDRRRALVRAARTPARRRHARRARHPRRCG